MISAVDKNIIWGMSGECPGQHLGHIVNNGEQSAVLHICDAVLKGYFSHGQMQMTSFESNK